MKKSISTTLSFLTVLMLVSTPAWSVSVNYYLDLNSSLTSLGVTPTDDGITGLLSQISFVQNSVIEQSASGLGGTLVQGDAFTEDGVGYADGFSYVNPGVDSEGLDSRYELTFTFTDLAGTVSSFDLNEVNFNFNNIGTVSAYLSEVNRNINIDINDPKPLSDYSNYNDGIKIGEFSVLSGSGNLLLSGPAAGNGGTFLNLKPIDDSAYYGIWFDSLDRDLFQELQLLTFFFADSTQTALESDPAFPTDGATSYTLLSTGNGGIRANVVPEPSTFLLLGAGLLGIGFIARRKEK